MSHHQIMTKSNSAVKKHVQREPDDFGAQGGCVSVTRTKSKVHFISLDSHFI